MKRFFLDAVTAFIFCIFFMTNQNFVSAAELNPKVKEKLDKEFSSMIGDKDEKVLGLGVIVYKDGEEVYKNFFGRRQVSPDKPMTENTLLRCASLSKMFTAFSLMQLVEERKISLKDDASKYLGFNLRNPNFPDEVITVEMLASHTSSIRDAGNYEAPQGEILEKFLDEKHFSNSKKPGEYFSYCNLNFGILATIIEKVTGKRFDIYQRENILKQLDTNADYLVSYLKPEVFENLGGTYEKNSDWTPQKDKYVKQPAKKNYSDYKIGTNATIFEPPGGLRISFHDLGNCLKMLLNRGNFNGTQIISEKSFDEMFSPHWVYNPKTKNGNTYDGVMMNYGLATYELKGGTPASLCKDYKIDLQGHSGEAYGLISGIYFMPGKRDGLLFMINGTAVSVEDKKALGKFSTGFIWEENVVNPVCKYVFAENGK